MNHLSALDYSVFALYLFLVSAYGIFIYYRKKSKQLDSKDFFPRFMQSTFPVGCQHSDRIVYPEFFALNPDSTNPRYNTKYGIYSPNCGLENVTMSWGHDEYLYQITKDYLPEPALYMIRYHSFYSQHREHSYNHLMSEHDHKMFEWVKKFNPYDLYSKSPVAPKVKDLKPYYEDLIAKYLPKTVKL